MWFCVLRNSRRSTTTNIYFPRRLNFKSAIWFCCTQASDNLIALFNRKAILPVADENEEQTSHTLNSFPQFLCDCFTQTLKAMNYPSWINVLFEFQVHIEKKYMASQCTVMDFGTVYFSGGRRSVNRSALDSYTFTCSNMNIFTHLFHMRHRNWTKD